MSRGAVLLLVLPVLLAGCLKFGWDRLSARVPPAVLDTIQPAALQADRAALEEVKGDDRATLQQLRRRMRSLGLTPAGEQDFLQPVALHLIQTTEARLAVAGALWPQDTFLGFSHRGRAEVAVAEVELVFVGHGIVAPEVEWDDYAGVDAAGKAVVLLEGDPGTAGGDSTLFRGRSPSIYARVDTKLEEARRHGAVAALLVPAADKTPWSARREAVRGVRLIRQEAARRSVEAAAWVDRERARLLFAAAGIELERAEWAARTRGFVGRELGVTADLRVQSAVRSTRSYNLAGEVTGRFASEQSLVVSAPWHDPAAAAGLLGLAKAVTELAEAPARSVLFVATAYGEDGHLGAAGYAANPYRESSLCAAAFALGSIDAVDSTTAVLGGGLSELGRALSQAAAEEGRPLLLVPPDGGWTTSEAGRYAAMGVPAVQVEAGAADLRVVLRALYRLAQTQGGPRWSPDSEYRYLPRD